MHILSLSLSLSDQSRKLHQTLHRFILSIFSVLFLLYKIRFKDFIACIIFWNQYLN